MKHKRKLLNIAGLILAIVIAGGAIRAYTNQKQKAFDARQAELNSVTPGPCQLHTDKRVIDVTKVVGVSLGSNNSDYQRGWLRIYTDDGMRIVASVDNMTVSEFIDSVKECRSGKPFYFNVN